MTYGLIAMLYLRFQSNQTLMKTPQLILSICLLLAFAKANAQHEKGDISVGLLAAPLTTDGQDDLGVISKLNAEFFVSSKFSFSSHFFISNNTLFRDQFENREARHSYGILATGQYYFINKEKWQAFGQLGYGFGFDDTTSGVAQNSALTIWTFGIGGVYRFSEHLGVKLMTPYFRARNITFDSNAARGVTVFLGFDYQF